MSIDDRSPRGVPSSRTTPQRGRRTLASAIKIGKPIDFSRFEGLAGNRFVERAVTDEVMYELMLLSGQEYVDVYAASLKKAADKPVLDAELSGARSSSVDPERLPNTKAS